MDCRARGFPAAYIFHCNDIIMNLIIVGVEYPETIGAFRFAQNNFGVDSDD